MRHVTVAMVAAAAWIGMAATEAPAIEGFRGASWGELRWDLPKEGEDNLLLTSWIRQGADWKRWGNTTLNTYATIRLRSDTEKLDWNNSIGPGLGIAVDTFNDKGISASVGIEYIWDRFYESDRSEDKAVVYLNWYGGWDLDRRD